LPDQPPPNSVAGALKSGDDGALSFDDAHQNQIVVPATVNPWASDFTVELWMKVAHHGHNQIALLAGQYLTNGFRFAPTWRLSDDAGPVTLWTTESGPGNSGATVRTLTEMGAGGFHHYAFRWSKATGEFVVLVDGVLDGQAQGGYVPASPGLMVGAGGGYHLDGAIDELAIYDHAVSDERLRAHYQAGSGLCGPGPIEH
jgi:hypothetical protein